MKFIRLFANPLFIAAVLSLMLLPFLNRFLPKYQAKVTENKVLPKSGSYILWADINLDGESENILWFINTEGKATVKISNQND